MERRPEGSFFVDPNDPEASVPSPVQRHKDKLTFAYYLMELSDKALKALKNQEYEQAAKYFRAMTKAVPENPLGWGRLCETYQAQNKPSEAEAACMQAVKLPGATVGDLARTIELMVINRPEAITDAEQLTIDTLLGRIAQVKGAELTWAKSFCRVGARLEHAERLRGCVHVLNQRIPHDPLTISYNWALAAAERDADAMAREYERAERAGLPPAALATMREGGELLLRKHNLELLKWGGAGFGAFAILAGAGYYFWRRREKGTLAHV